MIGFGGEEYSSDDDDDYPTYQEAVAVEADNEEEDKEFRKLTKSNTDFNSVPANLKNERCAAGVGQPNGGCRNGAAYSELKFGVPVLDAEGRRQTLQVTVEPFRNSVTVVNGACNGEAKSRPSKSLPVTGCLRNDKTDKEREMTKNSNRDDETGVAARECRGDAKSEDRGAAVEKGADEVEGPADAAEALGDLSAGCDSSNKRSDGVPEDPVNVLNVCLSEAEDTNNVFVQVRFVFL